MKKIGIIPVRMAASRFPGKPLFPILGRPMVEHVHARATMYSGWDALVVATCDEEIRAACEERGYTVIMTGDHHTRALDRVAEAVTKIDVPGGVSNDDIVVCVQGDEPSKKATGEACSADGDCQGILFCQQGKCAPKVCGW